MNDNNQSDKPRRGSSSARKSKNTFVTKSGQTIKINRNLTERLQARRDANARKKAARLAGLPKSRTKRIFYRMHPKRLYKYWFSREGLIMALKVTGISVIAGFLLLVGVFAYFRKDLPNIKDISGKDIGGSNLYYDKTGQTLLWEDVNGVKRIPVKDEEISTFVKDATIAIEDKDFFKHGGFDTRGIIRAGVNNAVGSGSTQGGSTITQQLVKVTNDWTKDRTVKRKIKELILSIELERSYSKKEILTGYLNAAPYGGVEYGVEAAARNYFQKSAKDLTLDEAAMLAAIPKSPTYFSPYSEDYFDRQAFTDRKNYILDLMAQQNYITGQQRDDAKKIDVIAKVKPRPALYENIKAPYFVLLAKKELETRLGANPTVQKGGWKVITTLDLKTQQLAEEQVSKGMGLIRRNGFDSAAFVAEDVKTGQVIALVGGSDFTNKDYGQNNYAHWRLPPGSSFKPYDYTSLIENTNDFGAGSVLYDTQGKVDGYPCTNKARPPVGDCLYNYDFRYPGPLTLRYALGGSRNVPAVKAMLLAGVDKTIETANKLGLESKYKCYRDTVEDVNIATVADESQCYVSAAIGDGAYLFLDEHVHAYATLSRNGNKIPQTYIINYKDSNGKMMYEWKPTKGEQAVREESAYIVADMMSDPRASYLGNKPHNYKGHKLAVKTGTTNDSKDGWMMGFSTQISAGIWVGHHTRRVATTAFMESMTQPIWQGFMQKAHDNLKPEERVKPAGLQSLPSFVVRSHVGISSIEPSPTNDLYPSWFKKKSATNAKKTIDIVSNKLATDCTPARAKKEVNEADASNSPDRFATANGSNSEQKDDIHKCDDNKPTIRLTATELSQGKYKLSADVTQGTHPLSSAQYPGTVNFKLDNQIIRSFDISSPGVVSFEYTTTFEGSKTVSAEVIDSVLYDSTDSATITGAGSGGAATGSPLTLKAERKNGKTKYTWSGGSGTYTVRTQAGAVPQCTATTTTCEGTILPAGTAVYIEDTAGNRDDTTVE